MTELASSITSPVEGSAMGDAVTRPTSRSLKAAM